MSFLIDTNICSAYLRGHQQVFNRFVQHSGGLFISSVTVGELLSWLCRAKTSSRYMEGFTGFLPDVDILDVDEAVAREYGLLRAGLLDRGRPTPAMDLLLAATALRHNLTMVTNNTKDFAHINGLRVVDWMTP